MKTLYIDCNMGAAGDMLMSALSELHPDPQGFITRLNSLNIQKVTVKSEKSMKCGITGTHIHVFIGNIEENEDMHHGHHHEHHHHSGMKDIDTANCFRVMIGEAENKSELIAELCCNIDDMTGEQIGFAVGKLLEAGASDVFTSPIYMKKNRPATMLTCICKERDKDKFVKLIFKHTSTIGIREHISGRYTLSRKEITVHTDYGDIRAKKSEGYGVCRIKAEYEDLAEIAEKNGISLSDIEITEG